MTLDLELQHDLPSYLNALICTYFESKRRGFLKQKNNTITEFENHQVV